MTGFADAVREWREALGCEHVMTDGPALTAAAVGTCGGGHAPVAIVAPADRSEVAAVLRTAGRCGVAVQPVSTGRNWGYGAARVADPGTTLLALHRLDRVVEVDAELAYAVVEPGVTFRGLAAALTERAPGLRAPRTGGSPDASVLATVLERGRGRTAPRDLAASCGGCDVVLADGTLLRTSGGDQLDPLTRSPAGPGLTALFQQSSLGVVTAMAVWLRPAPAVERQLVVAVPGPAQLGALVDTLRPVLQRHDDAVTAEAVNGFRVATQTLQAESGAVVDRAWLARRLGAAAAWTVRVTVTADSERVLGGHVDTICAAVAEAGLDSPRDGAAQPEVPATDGLRSLYWRKPGPVPADPDPVRDGCGALWCAPMVPMRGAQVAGWLAACERRVVEHGFEPSLSVHLGPRVAHAVLGLFWNRAEADGDERAARCAVAVLADAAERGVAPYRLGLQRATSADGGRGRFVARVRAAVDPAGALAPGRYSERAADRPRPVSPLVAPKRPPLLDRRFRAAEPTPGVRVLCADLEGHLDELCARLPVPLRDQARARLREYGGGGFQRLFPTPMYSFLHWCPETREPGVVAAARVAHGLALLLHLVDDHLADGQLAVDPLWLQVRTTAWLRFTEQAAAVAARTGADAASVRRECDRYLTAVHSRPHAPGVDGYLAHFQDEIAIWTLVPELVGGAPLAGVVAAFATAWRLLDDVADSAADATAGARSAVFHVLPPHGRAVWLRCAEDAGALAELDAVLAAEDAVPRCLDRAVELVTQAAAAARRLGLPGLADELAAHLPLTTGGLTAGSRPG